MEVRRPRDLLHTSCPSPFPQDRAIRVFKPLNFLHFRPLPEQAEMLDGHEKHGLAMAKQEEHAATIAAALRR